jgi:hypothetical protein
VPMRLAIGDSVGSAVTVGSRILTIMRGSPV